MNACELASRQPVWLALSEFYLDTELQAADFIRVREVFDQSGYSELEIRQIDYDEVGPLLYPNLLSVAGEWITFEETALLENLAKQAAKGSKIRNSPLHFLIYLKAVIPESSG
jgi:hypothetical protein